jgi:hypothetical protein
MSAMWHTDEWLFEAVESSFATGLRMPAGQLEVVLSSGPEEDAPRSTQIWAEGHLVSWRVGAAHEPDLTLEFSPGALDALLGGSATAFQGITVRARAVRSRLVTIPPTVEDLVASHPQRSIRSASARVDVTFIDDPMPLERVARYGFLDGMPVPPSALPADVPHVSIGLPFVGGVGFLLGQVPFSEIAGVAQMGDDLLAISTLTGLFAPYGLPSPAEFASAGQACLVLAGIAELRTKWPSLST